MRIGVASIVQESNTFAVARTSLADLESQGLYRGEEAAIRMAGTNSELAGALEVLEESEVEPVPLLRAWAMSGGPLERHALTALGELLDGEIQRAGTLDALVLSLHGALAAEGEDDADAWLLDVARRRLGSTPIGVCLDLHANVTKRLVGSSDALIGYHTYPHVDQAETGRRIGALIMAIASGSIEAGTSLAKRPMLLPAETTQTTDGQMAALRRLADRLTTGDVLDISLFPVQPWLDVNELGFAVTVTADQAGDADTLADDLAEVAWSMRHSFQVDLVPLDEAIRRASGRRGSGPLLVSESADSPTAGCAGDSPAVVEALLRAGDGLRAYVTLVDPGGVATAQRAGVGADVEIHIGASVDRRFHRPIALAGHVENVGDSIVRLEGPAFTGMEVSMGRWAVVQRSGLSVLLTERPACTFDPATFRAVGLAPEAADLIAVRSANLFRAGFASVSRESLILDLPGASTPRLETLEFLRAPRPLYPVDAA